MRLALLLLVACTQSGSEPDVTPCGTFPHGLGPADLDGMWTFEGSETTQTSGCDGSNAQATTTADSFPVKISVTACDAQGTSAGASFSGPIQDGCISADAVGIGYSHGSVTICLNADRTASFAADMSYSHCAQGGGNGGWTDSGSLSR